MTRDLHPLIKVNLIFLLFFLIFGGMYFGRDFFIPLTFAAILAMLLTPLCIKFEKLGLGRILATTLCILILLTFFVGLGALISTQIAGFSDDFPQMQQQLTKKVTDVQQFIAEKLGISPEEQKEVLKNQSSESDDENSILSNFLNSFTSFSASSLLMLVYLFMLINYRQRFSGFVLKVVSESKRQEARQIITDSSRVAQQYLVGRVLLILTLMVCYTIGFVIIGLENALLLAIIASVMSIIPYIGNIIGIAFPLLMALMQEDGLWLFLGVIIIFSVVQFVESYIMEPYIVGAEVDIHPFFTIVIIVIGELVWGISGMILAIPLLGIIKIVFSHIDSMKPYAYLISGGKTEDQKKWWKKLL